MLYNIILKILFKFATSFLINHKLLLVLINRDTKFLKLLRNDTENCHLFPLKKQSIV